MEIGIGAAGFVAAMMLWELLVYVLAVPDYIVPAPTAIWAALCSQWSFLWPAVKCTAHELLLGTLCGAAIAFVLGVASSESSALGALVYPFAVTTQVVPKIALVPILLIWCGNGLAPKLIVVAMIAFFPMLQNTTVGLKSVSRELIDVMRAAHASRLQMLSKVRIPSALFLMTSALRVSAIYGVVGAITAEFVGADEGLGYLILLYKNGMETPHLFAALVMASTLGAVAWGTAAILERIVQAIALRSMEDLRW